MNPKGPPTPASPALWRLDAAAIADAQGTRLARASILLEATGPSRKQSEPLVLRGRSVATGPYRVVAVGAAHEIDRHPACAARGLSGPACRTGSSCPVWSTLTPIWT